MIFNNYYDNLLWYILKTDKANRKFILNFIKGIPQEFFNEIKKAISKYKEFEIVNQDDALKFKEIKKAVKINDNNAYGFSLNEEGILYLVKVATNNEGKKEMTSISLGELTKEDEFDYFALPIKDFCKIETTTIEKDPWNPNGYEVVTRTEYGLLKSLTGHYITKVYDGEKEIKDSTRAINIKRVPSDIYLSDLERFNEPKKLSKAK